MNYGGYSECIRTSVAGRWLDERVARLNPARFLRVLHHSLADSVFNLQKKYMSDSVGLYRGKR